MLINVKAMVDSFVRDMSQLSALAVVEHLRFDFTVHRLEFIFKSHMKRLLLRFTFN